MPSEVARHTDFSAVRYAQCWEDADVLLEALDIQEGDTCLSIASGGDNTLAMLTRNPGRVIAVDLSAAQLACLELRVAAYRTLSHAELLALIGSTPSADRHALYRRCRRALSNEARGFWDAHGEAIRNGIGSAGKFERYFALFRTRALPLVHSHRRVEQLLQGGSRDERHAFYEQCWNTWRWRMLFRVFFSRFVMGRLGRDPKFFRYVEGSVADRFLLRVRHGLTELDPAGNPYLQWILTGCHTTALPYALRPQHFEAIRANVNRLEWKQCSIEDYLHNDGRSSIDRFNLSDIFEYMSYENYEQLLDRIVTRARPGGRLAYWNTFAPRSRPQRMAHRLNPMSKLASELHRRDKAFFYGAFVVEEIV